MTRSMMNDTIIKRYANISDDKLELLIPDLGVSLIDKIKVEEYGKDKFKVIYEPYDLSLSRSFLEDNVERIRLELKVLNKTEENFKANLEKISRRNLFDLQQMKQTRAHLEKSMFILIDYIELICL